MEAGYWASLEAEVDSVTGNDSNTENGRPLWNAFHVEGRYYADPGSHRQARRHALEKLETEAAREDRIRSQLATLVAWDTTEHGPIDATANPPRRVFDRIAGAARNLFARNLTEAEQELLAAAIARHTQRAQDVAAIAHYGITERGRVALGGSR